MIDFENPRISIFNGSGVYYHFVNKNLLISKSLKTLLTKDITYASGIKELKTVLICSSMPSTTYSVVNFKIRAASTGNSTLPADDYDFQYSQEKR